MNVESAKNLRAKFESGIEHAKDMIKHIEKYKITGDTSAEESIELQKRLIENYTRSIDFINRNLP